MKSSRNVFLVLLVMATATIGAVAWRQNRELLDLRSAALQKDERVALQKRIWDLERMNRELSDEIAALRNESVEDGNIADTVTAVSGGSEAPAPERRTSPRRGNAGRQQLAMRELMAQPEVQAAIDVQRKFGIEQRYAALFKNLGLTPDQADKLKALLAERQHTVQDIMMVAREQGINPRNDPDAFRKLIDEAEAEINQNIKAVIGESGFAQMQNYEQTLPQRNVVNALQQRLSYSDTPLTTQQAEQLVQILAANTPGGRSGNSGNTALAALRTEVNALAGAFVNSSGVSARGMNVPITADAISQAQGVLSQPQVNALRQLREQQQAQQQLQQLIRSTMQQNSGRRTGGTAAPGAGTATAPTRGPGG